MMELRRWRMWLMLSACAFAGCRGPEVVQLASTSITVPADWHRYTPDAPGYMNSLHLQRNGIPFLEQDSIASFYVSSNQTINTAQGAAAWQSRTAKSTVGNFVRHTTERIDGQYPSFCVSGTNAGGVEVLDCVVVGAPLMLSFAGSKQAEDGARTMLRSLQ